MSEERWAYFLSRWEAYKKGCELSGEGAMDQLIECMTEPVREDHYRQFSGEKPVDEKALAWIIVWKRKIVRRSHGLGWKAPR